MIDGRKILWLTSKNDILTYDNITAGQRDLYTSGCLLDYPYLKKYNKMVARDLSKQQALKADLKSIQ